jgi:hypothetical protein
MSIRVTGWPIVLVLIIPLCNALRLALWLTVRLCLQLCAKFLYCTMADGTGACTCVPSSCVSLWLTVRLCLQLCAKFLYCTMADGTFVPAAVCQVLELHYDWRHVCVCSCKPSSCVALRLTVLLCLQLCAKFLYCTMADGTFVSAAVCQVLELHYGWRHVCVCSCVPSSCIALWLTVRLCLQLCAKFLYYTMADGTFVSAAVCQVLLLHYG